MELSPKQTYNILILQTSLCITETNKALVNVAEGNMGGNANGNCIFIPFLTTQ